jgi:hypothetical protein
MDAQKGFIDSLRQSLQDEINLQVTMDAPAVPVTSPRHSIADPVEQH